MFTEVNKVAWVSVPLLSSGHDDAMPRLLWIAALLGLVSCLPIPTVRLDVELPPVTYRSSPSTVPTDYVTVPGFDEVHTPDALDWSYYLRYYRPEDTPDTVLILVPGIFGGATSMDELARQLVASTPGLEVWGVDRRANALEDRSAFLKSLQKRDPSAAYRYYVENEGKPGGFVPVPPKDLSFMGYWGLDVHLRDLHAVVSQARRRAPRVVLGGHSLGASLVGLYAAYNFGTPGNPDPGDDHIDGLLLIDGSLGRTGGFGIDPGLTTVLGILPDVQGLETGADAPYLGLGLGSTFQAQREVLALLARFAPDRLAPDAFVKFPATNRAAFGILEADRYGPVTVFTSSLGEAVGATFGGNLTAFVLGGVDSATSRTVTGVANGFHYVDWARGDPATARTDIDALARGWSTPQTNRSEWYFPLRLAVDVGEAGLRLDDDPGFVPNASVTTPTLAVGAGRGLVKDLSGFEAYNNVRPGSLFSTYILPGLTHLDIVEAEDNPLVSLFKLWTVQLERVEGKVERVGK